MAVPTLACRARRAPEPASLHDRERPHRPHVDLGVGRGHARGPPDVQGRRRPPGRGPRPHLHRQLGQLLPLGHGDVARAVRPHPRPRGRRALGRHGRPVGGAGLQPAGRRVRVPAAPLRPALPGPSTWGSRPGSATTSTRSGTPGPSRSCWRPRGSAPTCSCGPVRTRRPSPPPPSAGAAPTAPSSPRTGSPSTTPPRAGPRSETLRTRAAELLERSEELGHPPDGLLRGGRPRRRADPPGHGDRARARGRARGRRRLRGPRRVLRGPRGHAGPAGRPAGGGRASCSGTPWAATRCTPTSSWPTRGRRTRWSPPRPSPRCAVS